MRPTRPEPASGCASTSTPWSRGSTRSVPPPWEFFDDADLVDLDDTLRSGFRAHAVPQPRRVASDRQVLCDERRLAVPATMIACEFPSASIASGMAAGAPAVSELGRIHDVEYVDLPTGHWPQFTAPAELAAAILAAVR